MAYCCRDFVVKRRKVPLRPWLSFVMTRCRDAVFFQSANRSWFLIGCNDQDGLAHGFGGFARFFHFKITF